MWKRLIYVVSRHYSDVLPSQTLTISKFFSHFFFQENLFEGFFFLYLRDGVVDDILLGFDDLQGILLWFLRFYRNIKHSADFYGKIQSIFLLNIDQVYEVYISWINTCPTNAKFSKLVELFAFISTLTSFSSAY